jgi:hypothetical protein
MSAEPAFFRRLHQLRQLVLVMRGPVVIEPSTTSLPTLRCRRHPAVPLSCCCASGKPRCRHVRYPPAGCCEIGIEEGVISGNASDSASNGSVTLCRRSS